MPALVAEAQQIERDSPSSESGLEQTGVSQLLFDVRVVDRGCNQARNSERNLHCEHRDQEFPGAGLYSGAHNSCVQEIFQLVNDHEEDQSSGDSMMSNQIGREHG